MLFFGSLRLGCGARATKVERVQVEWCKQAGLQASKKTIQREAKARKWAAEHEEGAGTKFDFEKIKAQRFDGTIQQLLEKGKAGMLRINTFHYAGWHLLQYTVDPLLCWVVLVKRALMWSATRILPDTIRPKVG